ncbi:MAG: glycosyltransferase family 2 protein [Bdellovibrionales bacterium]|nr:glycosyltransferase family 2 protein [Bdellovibrionales bacterium]
MPHFSLVICIPVFDNPGTIVDVIEACLLETPHPIFVIDDGSQISVESLFKARCGPGEKRVSFYRDDQNQGKGQALQRGFVEAVRCGFTHLIAIDGDGQHVPAEIVKLERAAIESPWALIVGDRDMKSQNVPGSSVFGKKFSNFWVRYQTDVGVGDSQSGFRIYPLYLLQNMKFYCKKYDFEIEVLIRLIWSGVEVRKRQDISALFSTGNPSQSF